MIPSTNLPAQEKTTPLVRFISRVSLGVLALGLTLAACGGQTDVTSEDQRQAIDASAVAAEVELDEAIDADAAEPDADATDAAVEADVEAEAGDIDAEEETAALSSLAEQIVELPSALPEVALVGVGDQVGDQPLAINLPSLGVSNAAIVPVGLEPNGELEVPEADTVGWYQFGVGVDGGQGSAVLAAHIAYNGQDGVFRDLIDLEPGETISIERGGEPIEYVIETVVDYDKWELPIDDFFSESGDERVILITCGGAFNPELASYEDNTVAIAVPVSV